MLLYLNYIIFNPPPPIPHRSMIRKFAFIHNQILWKWQKRTNPDSHMLHLRIFCSISITVSFQIKKERVICWHLYNTRISREHVYEFEYYMFRIGDQGKCAPGGTPEAQSGRKFQRSWLKQFPWIIYEETDDQVFCKACKEPRNEQRRYY